MKSVIEDDNLLDVSQKYRWRKLILRRNYTILLS